MGRVPDSWPPEGGNFSNGWSSPGPVTLSALEETALRIRPAAEAVAEAERVVVRIVMLHAALRGLTWERATEDLVASAPSAVRVAVRAGIDAARRRYEFDLEAGRRIVRCAPW